MNTADELMVLAAQYAVTYPNGGEAHREARQTLRAAIEQALAARVPELTDSQIMASIGRNSGKDGMEISQTCPLGLQWDEICNLIRKVISEYIGTAAPQPAQQVEWVPDGWRELCRRLYVELFHCDQQMMSARKYGKPMWTQGSSVRDVLRDAKDMLAAAPQPAQQAEWVDDAGRIQWALWRIRDLEDKLREKNEVEK